MLKAVLRKRFLALRNELTIHQVEELSLALANQVLKAPIWNKTYYHIFLPILEKKEIDTGDILTILQGKDKNIVLPKMCANGTLKHYLLTDNTVIKTNSWHVPEPVDGILISPAQLEVVFVPLLAFDKTGNRVGYGKGYYDRFLAECPKEVLKVGISFFEATPEQITDCIATDIKLDYCVTPNNIYTF